MDDFEQAPRLPLDDALERPSRFAEISATGRFDTRRHIMLDNRVLGGKAGVHVYTPFTNFSGTTVLVNRGWKPLPADRSGLPDVWTPAVPVKIRGLLSRPPEHRQRLGKPDVLSADAWPQLVTYLDIEAVSVALGRPLPESVILLAEEDPTGFAGRDWEPAVMTPERHQAYAVQWFALAATALVIWGILLLRWRGRSGKAGSP